jgi:hypothetical protein
MPFVKGPCAHPMHGGAGWYLYKRDPCTKWRNKMWALVRALTFIKYVKQSRSRALVMHAMLQSGLPEELRERKIHRMSNVMPIRNANYFCCKTKLDFAVRSSMLVFRDGRVRSWVKLWGGGKRKGCFVYTGAVWWWCGHTVGALGGSRDRGSVWRNVALCAAGL